MKYHHIMKAPQNHLRNLEKSTLWTERFNHNS